MRKKPDSLLLLAVLVVSGVILSQFVIVKKDNRSDYLSVDKNANYQQQEQLYKQRDKSLSSHEVVRIDSSKQQTR